MAHDTLLRNTIACLACFVLSSCAWLREVPAPLGALGTKPTTIIAANVGAGNCVLILCPNGSQILNDCGSLDGSPDSAIKLIKDQIATTKSLYVAISHSDRDHYSLISQVAPDVTKVKAVYIGGDEKGYTKLADWFAELYKKNKVKPQNPLLAYDPKGKPDQTLRCTDQTMGNDGIYVLSYNAGFTKNDRSLVLKQVQGNTSATIMGDSEEHTEENIMNNYGMDADFLHTDMLVAAHHGSSNKANSEVWAKAVQAKSVIYSAGDRENFGHPRCEVVNRYATKSLSTASVHPLTCFIEQYNSETRNLKRAQVNTYNSGALRYWTDGDKWTLEACADNDLTNCEVVRP